jgi:hypothetical protein
MKSSEYSAVLFVGLAITVFSAPIPSDFSPTSSDVTTGLGFCTILTALSLGTTILSYCMKGVINNHNNHKAIDHFFSEMKKWEAEKATLGQATNRTDVKVDNSKSELESGSDSKCCTIEVEVEEVNNKK